MKLKDSINYAFTKAIRNKKNIYFIIILMICAVLLLGSLYYKTIFIKLNQKYNDNNVLYRNILISPNQDELYDHYYDKNYDYGYNKVLEINHVQEIYNLKYNAFEIKSPTFKNNNYSGVIELLYGSEYSLPKKIIGKSFKSTDTGVAICPKNFYPSQLSNINFNSKNIFLQHKDLINKTFEIENNIYSLIDGKATIAGKYNKSYKIIGLYDTTENGNMIFNCYISGNDIKELYDKTFSAIEGDGLVSYVVTVDNAKNVDYVMKEIAKLGFRVDLQVERDETYINNIQLICNLISFLTAIAITIITALYIKKRNVNNFYEVGIMKAIGYKHKDIQLTNMFQILLMSILSTILGIIIFEILYIIIRIYFKNYFIIKGLELAHYIVPYLITSLVVLIIPLVTNYIFSFKLLQKSTITILKGTKS